MKKYIYTLVGIVIVAGIIFVVASPAKPSIYDGFAQCLKDKGAIFYGTFWCPHCQSQKAKFGTAVKYLPYVECSTSNGQGQTQVCKDAGITNYPTWQFNASSTNRLVGEQELSLLAEKTGCELPK